MTNDTGDYETSCTFFKQWLCDNGASFGKISWPSDGTVSGIRGAIAVEDILTNEFMIQIPAKLMISPPIALSDPEIGEFLRKNSDVLKGDVTLTVYLMHERRKGLSSFYFPYLRILPIPGTIAHWSPEELAALQRCVVPLSERHPDVFPPDEFTLESYSFCWYTIQARAFGRRLPWTALVPFADCLNHTNAQTKYDYEIGENGLFRLFPTGCNRYPKGSEVFNSYGRRPNDNLLIDYGFSMVDNEWDSVEVVLTVPPSDPLHESRGRILYNLGKAPFSSVVLNKKDFPLQALSFLRIVHLTAEEISHLDDEAFKMFTEGSAVDDDEFDVDDSEQPKLDGSRLSHASRSASASQRFLYGRIISLSNERKAVVVFKGILDGLMRGWKTALPDDERLLTEVERLSGQQQRSSATDPAVESGVSANIEDAAGSLSGAALEELRELQELDAEGLWRRKCAMIYRITRKRIVESVCRRAEALEHWLEAEISRRLLADGNTPDDSDVAMKKLTDLLHTTVMNLADECSSGGTQEKTHPKSSSSDIVGFVKMKAYAKRACEQQLPVHLL